MGEIRKHTKYRNTRMPKDRSISATIKDTVLTEGIRDYCKRNDILVSLFVEKAAAKYLAEKISEEKDKRISEFINNIACECSQETLSKIVSLLSSDERILEEY